MVIWHYKDSRLQPMQQVQENADKNFSFLCAYRPAEQKFLRLADDDVRVVNATPGLEVRLRHRYPELRAGIAPERQEF